MSCRSEARRGRYPRPSLLVLVLAALPAASCLAQSAAASEPGSRVRVTGEAVVTAEPDRVVVMLGAMTEADGADEAVSHNAKQVAAVLEALHAELGKAAEIETSGYDLSPRYRHRKEGGQELTGYRVTSRLRVTLGDVDRTGRVIDVATRAGATEVRSVSFQLRDDAPQRRAALEQATRRARESADAVAAALDLRVKRVLLVEEAGLIHRPLRMEGARLMSMQADPSTPIEAAGVKVSARVVMEAEVGK